MNTSLWQSQESRLDHLLDELVSNAAQAKREPSVDELKRRRIIDSALLEASRDTAVSTALAARRPRLRVTAVIAASVASLLAAWLWVESGSEQTAGKDAPYRTAAGPVIEDGPGQAGDAISNPSHVHMEFAPGIQAVVKQDTQFNIDRTRLSRIVVRISRGAVWVTKDPGTEQTQLGIETPKGTVLVTGTVFSVHVDNGTLRVAVLRGAVQVVEEAGPVHTVAAGFLVTVNGEGAEVTRIPSPEETRAEFVQLGILEEEVPVRWPETATPALGDSPGGQRSASGEPGEPRVSAKDLLNQISLLRQQKDWVQMSITYRRLIRNHRRSPQAGLAMVSLGNLLLEKLDDPEEAIHWFDVYLKTKNGALAPEALFGKAKALRRLGNRRAELAVLQEVVKRYPESLYGKRAAEWIAQREQK